MIAGVLLIQVTIHESREGLAVWLLWGLFELVMKVVNLLNDIKYFFNHVVWIHQLLLLTFAAALYRTLKKKEGELSRGGDRGNGRAVNDLQDGLELNRWGPEVDVEVEGRLEGRTSKTPPSSPRLREVRVVRGMRRRLGSSL